MKQWREGFAKQEKSNQGISFHGTSQKWLKRGRPKDSASRQPRGKDGQAGKLSTGGKKNERPVKEKKDVLKTPK